MGGLLKVPDSLVVFLSGLKANCSHQVNIGSHGRTLSFFPFLLLFLELFWDQVGVNLLFLPPFVPHADSPPKCVHLLVSIRLYKVGEQMKWTWSP